MFYIEISIIAVIVIFQIIAFFATRQRMRELRNFFPSSITNIDVKKIEIPERILKNSKSFSKFLESINKDASKNSWEDEPTEKIEVLVGDSNLEFKHPKFFDVIKSTNAYLCKNIGASADFNILQDICERQIQRVDNSIGNLINVPLYIGLAGTFVGIIAGLLGVDFMDNSGAIDPESINALLQGVVVAMTASLLGLIFTVINTAFTYKSSVYKNDTGKNQYYDFVQRELLPVLNIGMAGSLSSFRSVLDSFIMKFGDNISEYYDTAELLNDNLAKQHLVLEEINKLSLTRTATTIASTFADLKNASDQFNQFFEYQKKLNQNIVNADKVVDGLNTAIEKYQKFNHNLEVISDNVSSSIAFQKQFKESLEVHFPTMKDHKEVWREHVDEVNSDIKEVYKKLVAYFQSSSENIQQFMKEHERYYTNQNEIQNGMEVFIRYAKVQNDQFKSLNDQVLAMRKDLTSSQKATLDLNTDLVKAIKDLTIKLSRPELNSVEKQR